MAKRRLSTFVRRTGGPLMVWGGSMSLAAASTRASPSGGLLNDTPQQVSTAVLLSVFLVLGCAAVFLFLRAGRSQRRSGHDRRSAPPIGAHPTAS